MTLTNIVRDIRKKQKVKTSNSLSRPTSVWNGKDLLDGKVVSSLTIIFQTIGCRWNNCVMCGYVYDSAESSPSHDDFIKQFEYAMSKAKDEKFVVKIFTSGSFFDNYEIKSETRKEILSRLELDDRVIKVIAETRPEYVTEKNLKEVKEVFNKKFEIAIGLETSNDVIREDCINKGFSFSDFVKASEIAKSMDVTVKAYLLLKPIFLSESVAISDMIKSIKEVSPYSQTISLNVCNVQKGTLVDEMFERKDYRPPWLWSVIEVLKKANLDITIISDPVGAGSKRGPHNCGNCDKDIAEAIRIFSLTQDKKIFDSLYCECLELWKKVVEFEELTFGSPLVK